MSNVSGVCRLGSNPELKMVGPEKDKPVCEFRANMSNGRYDNNSGQWIDNSYWVDVSVWGSLAEVAAKLFQKGDRVFLEGNQYLHKWVHEGEEYSQMKIDTRAVHPHAGDIDVLQFKPRNKKQQVPETNTDNVSDDIPFQSAAQPMSEAT